MEDKPDPVVQLVMKRADGRSVLDSGAGSAQTAGQGDVDDARATLIRSRLQELGFKVAAGNLNTLSIMGPDELFKETFGLDPSSALAANVPAHATNIPEALDEFVADVFVTPAPDLFP